MILYGAGGHCKVIVEILEGLGVEITEIWDDTEVSKLWNYDVTKPNLDIDNDEIIISVGINEFRRKLSGSIKNLKFGVAIHRESIVSPRSFIDVGTVIMAGVTINADVKIGMHCIVNTNAAVDHDCLVADYVHISPNATLCGRVEVGEGSHIGAGAVILPGIKIGKWCTIGAGSVIIRDVADGTKIVGNPGRIIN